MNKNLLPIHFAPLQGYTDAAYRQAHACIIRKSKCSRISKRKVHFTKRNV